MSVGLPWLNCCYWARQGFTIWLSIYSFAAHRIFLKEWTTANEWKTIYPLAVTQSRGSVLLGLREKLLLFLPSSKVVHFFVRIAIALSADLPPNKRMWELHWIQKKNEGSSKKSHSAGTLGAVLAVGKGRGAVLLLSSPYWLWKIELNWNRSVPDRFSYSWFFFPQCSLDDVFGLTQHVTSLPVSHMGSEAETSFSSEVGLLPKRAPTQVQLAGWEGSSLQSSYQKWHTESQFSASM